MKTGMGTSMSKEEIQQELKKQWLPNWAKLADQSPISPSPQEARLLNMLDEQERRMPGSTKPKPIDKALFLDLPEGVTFDHPQARRRSMVQRILQSPNVVITVAAVCVGVSAVFCGLGYWWVLSHNGTAPTAYELMGLSDMPHSHGQAGSSPAQSIFRMAPPEPEDTDGNAMLAQAGDKNTGMSIEDIKQDLREPSGRSDPFSPLVQPVSPTTGPDSMIPEKRDLLLDVQYTGFIGDANAKDKVAILKISDPAGGTKTVIKKIGESFLVEGEKALLKGISKDRVQLTLEGQTRWLDLHPYQESNASSNTNTSGTTPATPASPAMTGSSQNAGNGNAGGNSNNTSDRFPNLKTLQER